MRKRQAGHRNRASGPVRIAVAAAAGIGVLLGVAACTDSGTSGGAPPASERSTPSMNATGGSNNSAATKALFDAARKNDAETARKALADGADLEARAEAARTPLILATRANAIDVARLLLDAGASPNAKDSLEDSAFLYAGAEGLDEILQATLDHGADVTSTNRYGGTALIPASEHAHVSTVKILLKAGVPVNHVNNLSWTALHEAIVLGNGSADHVETVRLLIEGGADVTIPDGNGISPRELAAAQGYDKIVTLIDGAR